jgi:hypothetical protein
LCILAACGRWGYAPGEASIDGTSDVEEPDADVSVLDANVMVNDPAELLVVEPPPFSTSSTTFVEVPGSALSIPPGESWLIAVQASLRSTSADAEASYEVRYLIDGQPRGIGSGQSFLPLRSQPWTHFTLIQNPLAQTSVTVELRDELGTADIDSLVISAVPLPPGAVISYVENDATIGVPSATPTALLSQSVDAAAGALILAAAAVNEAPSRATIRAWFEDGSGTTWPDGIGFSNNRGNWGPLLWAREYAGPQNFTLMAIGSGIDGASAAHLRFLALRSSAFVDMVGARGAPETIASDSPTLVSPGTIRVGTRAAPNPALVVQTVAFLEESGESFERTVQFLWNGSVMGDYGRDCTASCSDVSYSLMRGVSDSSELAIETHIGGSSAFPMQTTESSIFVLGL